MSCYSTSLSHVQAIATDAGYKYFSPQHGWWSGRETATRFWRHFFGGRGFSRISLAM
jgi:hypothetical protein